MAWSKKSLWFGLGFASLTFGCLPFLGLLVASLYEYATGFVKSPNPNTFYAGLIGVIVAVILLTATPAKSYLIVLTQKGHWLAKLFHIGAFLVAILLVPWAVYQGDKTNRENIPIEANLTAALQASENSVTVNNQSFVSTAAVLSVLQKANLAMKPNSASATSSSQVSVAVGAHGQQLVLVTMGSNGDCLGVVSNLTTPSSQTIPQSPSQTGTFYAHWAPVQPNGDNGTCTASALPQQSSDQQDQQNSGAVNQYPYWASTSDGWSE